MAFYGHHICGLYYLEYSSNAYQSPRKYLPQVSLSAHATILSSVSRTTLTQTFVNPKKDAAIPELRYTFPLYDGASVVGFTCTINKTRVIHGIVKEKEHARQTFNDAVARGETAGLLEQLPNASDVFTTTVGNVPAGAEIKIDVTFLLELKHDAQVDGIRFTLPTSIAPRYGSYPGELASKPTNVGTDDGISITVDAEMPEGSSIRAVQSPSHPISVSMGLNSTSAADVEPSLRLASATLSLDKAELDADFVLQVVATNTSNPVAILETHPTIPHHRALMATLVPKFNLPSSRPEVVFVCDRSGSMGLGSKIPNLKSALRIFLKSLPLGVKFNICSFGSRHSYLFPERSQSYGQATLDAAMRHIDTFSADFGGTEMYQPIEDTIKRRYKDMELEVFVLTDGDLWAQDELFAMVNKHVAESKGAVRVFTLGVGVDASHALVEGLARAGNGFSQSVTDNEKMDAKVVRMLKGALTPHIRDYSLEVKYADAAPEAGTDDDGDDDDFEIVERVLDGLQIEVPDNSEPDMASTQTSAAERPKQTISLFDNSADPDVEMTDPNLPKDTTGTAKYSHVPPVSPPKLLQAPFQIPPLFPFNRTSVYLLLSPETAQKTPKSVILRGTSDFGPLELEIPVSATSSPGETIHQLAARKAVKELEEGRGWLFHAKDVKDGKLLKTKYEGRFGDMVEREAVRLGVQFQVGGKWCSFVAVEDHDGEEQEHAEEVATVPAADTRSDTRASRGGGMPAVMHRMARMAAPSSTPGRGRGGLFSVRPPGALGTRASIRSTAGPPAPAPAPPHPPPAAIQALPSQQAAMQQQMQMQRMPQQQMQQMSHYAVPACAPASSGLFSASRPAGMAFASPQGQDMTADFDCDSFLDDSSEPASAGQDFRLASRESASPRRSSVATMKKRKKHAKGEEASGGDSRDRLRSPTPPTDPLEALVALQTFDGSWAWTDELFAVLETSTDAVAASPLLATLSREVVATALVVAFLRKKLVDEKDAWEMMVEKALDWMNTQPGVDGSAENVLQAAEGFF